VPAILFAWAYGLDALLHPGFGTIGWLIGLTLVHEGSHAVGWKLASGLPWNAFRIGFSWKALTPYCHSRSAMPVGAYRIGSLLPLALTGLLPWAAAMITGYADLGIAASILIGGAAGDVWVFSVIRDLAPDVLVRDHPEQAGCIVIYPD
jgi:hypothetical protein